MHILVTGRQGQVAQSIGERIAGHRLTFVGRPEFDLAAPDSIERVVAEVAPDVVLSVAAYTAVDRAEDEPDAAMAINGTAPGVLARAAKRAGAAMVHLSTDYVFDGALDRPYVETDAVGPTGAYGRSKLAGEQAIAESGADCAIVRTAWVYSPFGQNFVKTMLRLGADRDELRVVADQIGCPTSALDIADALGAMLDWRAAHPDQSWGGLYHLAGSGEASWAELARASFAASAELGGPTARVVDIATEDWPTRANRPKNSRLNCFKFEEKFGYRAPIWQGSVKGVVSRLVNSQAA
ncbi:MAG: dTDP-4-dehydrorhamnose reductase [Sphingobium sp.]|nr:dTDP-4-dehydrorhamnose reductase [Sphingobium sp.]